MIGVRDGAVAGTVATLPMTLVFAAGRLTGLLRNPPPVQITETAEREAGVRDELSGPAFSLSWLAAHLAYGAACGALYARARPLLPARPAAAGLAYGAAVWGISYAALMPALGLYPAMRRDTPGRQAVTAAAHAVYGVVLALLAERAPVRSA